MVWDKIEQFLSLLPEPFGTEAKQIRYVSVYYAKNRFDVCY